MPRDASSAALFCPSPAAVALLRSDASLRRRLLTTHAPWWRAYPHSVASSSAGARIARTLSEVAEMRRSGPRFYACAREVLRLLARARANGTLAALPLP